VYHLQAWISIIEIGHSGLLPNDRERGDTVGFFLPIGGQKMDAIIEKKEKKITTVVNYAIVTLKRIKTMASSSNNLKPISHYDLQIYIIE
jgi:hypothetical protein